MLLLQIFYSMFLSIPADKWAWLFILREINFWTRILQFLKDFSICLTKFTPVTKFLNFSPWMYDDVTRVTVNIWQSRSAGLSLLLHPSGDMVPSVQLGYNQPVRNTFRKTHTRACTHTHIHPFAPCLSDSWVHPTVVHLSASVTAAW